VRSWERVRAYLERERHGLAVRAFARYGRPGVGGAPLLGRPEWLVDAPVPLRELAVEHRSGVPFHGETGHGGAGVLPDETPHSRYSDVLADLAPPGTLWNQPTYRLLEAELDPGPRLVVGDGWYFDGLDTGAAAAHEFAAYELGELRALSLRDAIGDPTDLTRRPVNLAISALTLRHDRTTGTATMPLHRRDAAKVGHAGGMIHVIPAGVFQPLGPQPWQVAGGLSPWRSMLHEYAEELAGEPGPDAADHDPFGARMTAARDAGLVRPYVLGLGVDPLTFATDLLVAVVVEAGTYDELFGAAVTVNAEGTVLPAVPFTPAEVDRYATREPTQAAGAALLRLAQNHRGALLG
jgi:hypothetical protein